MTREFSIQGELNMNEIATMIDDQISAIFQQAKSKSHTIADLNMYLENYFKKNRPYQAGVQRDVYSLMEQLTYRRLNEFIQKIKIES